MRTDAEAAEAGDGNRFPTEMAALGCVNEPCNRCEWLVCLFFLSSSAAAKDLRTSLPSRPMVKTKYCGILTDGSRLYFTVGSPLLTTYQVSVSGGDAKVAFPSNGCLLDISRDGSEFLARAVVLAGPGRPLDFPAFWPDLLVPSGASVADDARWMPDGEHIIYPNGESLYVVGRDGSEPHKFATVPGIPFGLTWSPDGNRLRFGLYDPKKLRTRE